MKLISVNKVKKNTKKFVSNEIKIIFMKFLFCNNKKLNFFYYIYFLIQRERFYKKKMSRILYKNYCLTSGHNRSVSRYLRMSRMQIKQYGLFGYIPGLRKN